MRLLFLLMSLLMAGNSMAISYEEETTVCAELKILDKSTYNCNGRAEFKEENGKYFLEVLFRISDFEIDDTKTRNIYRPKLKEDRRKQIIFQSPSYSADDWTQKLKEKVNLVTAKLLIGKDQFQLKDSVILKKKSGADVSYQIDGVIPLKEAVFITPPKGLKSATTAHLTLLVPLTEIKGLKF